MTCGNFRRQCLELRCLQHAAAGPAARQGSSVGGGSGGTPGGQFLRDLGRVLVSDGRGKFAQSWGGGVEITRSEAIAANS
eukprot:8221596-Pyramimonas_sp.AAC.1